MAEIESALSGNGGPENINKRKCRVLTNAASPTVLVRDLWARRRLRRGTLMGKLF